MVSPVVSWKANNVITSWLWQILALDLMSMSFRKANPEKITQTASNTWDWHCLHMHMPLESLGGFSFGFILALAQGLLISWNFPGFCCHDKGRWCKAHIPSCWRPTALHRVARDGLRGRIKLALKGSDFVSSCTSLPCPQLPSSLPKLTYGKWHLNHGFYPSEGGGCFEGIM